MQWQIDPNHTTITAAVKHMMLTTVRGGFGGATGVIDFDPAKPEAGGIELRIPAKNVNTHDEKRDAHLRSADFLDADNYPEIVFKSTKIAPQSKGEFTVDGDGLARHEVAQRRGEKEHGADQVLGQLHAQDAVEAPMRAEL